MQTPQRKVRYAVVGLGWIAQETVLPGFRNATPNSELVALVSGSEDKARALAPLYGARLTCAYDRYEALLASGDIDAVFLAVPNSLHKEFAVKAARAGVHVLCEKPLAANAAECEEIIRAAAAGGIRLMTAYRLHFEPGNLRAISLIASGKIGEPRFFSSVFSQQVDEGNARLEKDLGGGPIPDMGVYSINAARYAFRDEPVEVSAFGANNGERRFREVHEASSILLRFPGDRLAAFTCSFGAAPTDNWMVAGTKGWLRLEPAFDFRIPPKLRAVFDGRQIEETFPAHDQFGAEILYFSNCILENREPEPSGREGLADVRVVDAALRSMRTGSAVKLEPFAVEARPDESMKIELPPAEPARIVGASSPGGQS